MATRGEKLAIVPELNHPDGFSIVYLESVEVPQVGKVRVLFVN